MDSFRKIDNDNVKSQLKGLNAILVAPGFGERGIEGKITAIKYARENNVPFLGYALGCNAQWWSLLVMF